MSRKRARRKTEPALRRQFPTEFNAWRNMLARCHWKRGHVNYGRRGIRVCARWKRFEHFIADMGARPNSKFTLERKDVNGNYEKNNCVWTTRTRQMRNTRKTRYLNIEDEFLSLPDVAERFGISLGALRGRLAAGWSLDRALYTPVRTGMLPWGGILNR